MKKTRSCFVEVSAGGVWGGVVWWGGGVVTKWANSTLSLNLPLTALGSLPASSALLPGARACT